MPKVYESCVLDTPIVTPCINSNTEFITEIQITIPKETKGVNRFNSKVMINAVNEIKEYFDKNRKTFTIPIKLNTPLNLKSIVDQILIVKYGQTSSYSNIARITGNHKASRLVGLACSKNPILIVVPCHRIISKNKGIGGYTEGIKKKIYLLLNEKSPN